MPSFLTKVFGRKKDEKDAASPSAHNKRLSQPTSLLEGKYEAVSPNVSPSASHFPDAPAQQPAPAKESALSLFRSRSRNPDPARPSNVASTPAPHLTLNLPVPKEEKSRALGVVFEADPDSNNLLNDEAINKRRLSPLETLLLVKACSSAMIDRGGLESLGLMHPHWYSTSPEVQRKLISLFILSLGPKSPITTLSPSSTSPSLIFESELKYTRSPHDIAAVLRWGLRHLLLEGSSFGSSNAVSSSEWAWYQSFASAEREDHYPPTAFSKSLVPTIPPAHLQLLMAMLDIISSLAAHAEATGSSGSKLVKLFGLWLLSAERAQASENWSEFYKRWERAGRVFEHVFLAHVREEDAKSKMPLRLSELVKQYPYESAHQDPAGSTDDLPLLPIPRFSTRRRDALFVTVDTLLPTPGAARPSKEHPLRLISEALKSSAASSASIPEEVQTVWEDMKAKAVDSTQTAEQSYPALSKILDDETLRLLSLLPGGQSSASTATSPVVTASSPTTPQQDASARNRSASLGPWAPTNGHGKSATNGYGTTGTAPSLTNWADFSTIGFGESSIDKTLNLTLNDKDVEVTDPPHTPSRKASPPRGRRSSADSPARHINAVASSPDAAKGKTSLKQVSKIQVDEAFFDFWSDALLDPISSNWPAFVVCQLKPSFDKVGLLIIEQTFSHPAPPTPPAAPQTSDVKRASSPRPSVSASVGGRKSFSFSPTIKRFSFFSTHDAAKGQKGAKPSGRGSTKSPRIGEMGEILPEEDIPPVPAVPEQPAQVPQPPAAEEKPAQGLGLVVAPEPSAESTAPPTPISKEETSTPAPAPKDEAELPAVPLVEAAPIEVPEEVAPVATEPVKTEEEAAEKPTVAVPEAVDVPADTTPEVEDGNEKELPPAPEAVVLTGGTPGPEVALASSEPAAIAQVADAVEAEKAEEPAAPAEPEAAAVDEPSTTVPTAEIPQVEEEVVEPPAHSEEPVVEVSVPQEESSHEEPAEPLTAPPEPAVEDDVVESPAQPEEEPTAAADVPTETPAPSHDEPEPAAPVAHVVVPEEEIKAEEPAASQPEHEEHEEPSTEPQVSHEPEVVEELTEPVETVEPSHEPVEDVPAPVVEDISAPVQSESSAADEKETSHANGSSHVALGSESSAPHGADDTPDPHPSHEEEPQA